MSAYFIQSTSSPTSFVHFDIKTEQYILRNSFVGASGFYTEIKAEGVRNRNAKLKVVLIDLKDARFILRPVPTVRSKIE
jgi:hypothetical protein